MTGIRSYVMHGLMRAGLEPLVLWYWKKKGLHTDYLVGDRRRRFETIYKTGRWTGDTVETESLSGRGSTMSATVALRSELPETLRCLDARNLLDIGCGDFNWMREVDLPCSYVGVDIVPDIIEANTDRYGSASRRFLVLDAVAEPLPSADVVLCREVLFHLSLRDATDLLRNVRGSGARYLLATTDPTVAFNADIPTGAWRDINLELSPYGLGERVGALSDNEAQNPNRILGLWHLLS